RQQGEQQEATPGQQPAPMQPAPAEPPVGEMPPPASSSLSTPPDNGFQTVPDTTQQPNQGGQP
ncbi:MAG TPA: hypothetical protein VL178_11940, partial [Pseudomonas sp.]|nr:hypothetical protein [Pseudomonas sp.]